MYPPATLDASPHAGPARWGMGRDGEGLSGSFAGLQATMALAEVALLRGVWGVARGMTSCGHGTAREQGGRFGGAWVGCFEYF